MDFEAPLPEDDIERVLSASHGGQVWLSDGQRGTVSDFSANIWPYPLPEIMLQRGFSGFDAYPDPDYRGLISAAADYYEVEEGQVFPANGSTEALYLAMLTLKPRKIAVFEPTFSEYARAASWATSAQVDVVHILSDAGNIFRPELRVPESEVAIICNPNNPTGAYVPRRELVSWVDACAKSGVFVIVDEAFIEFVQEPQASLAHDLAGRTNLLVMRSMTKCFGIPGLRLGFALGPDKVIQQIWSNRIPWSINTVAQQLGTCLARSSPAQTMKIAEVVARERAFLSDRLREFGWTVQPSAANFVLCRLPSGSSNHGLLTNMLREGFLLRDASNFYGLDDSYVRCAVKERPDNELLLKAIARCI
jgi:threonine-phosphate decarboxylase